MKVSKFSFCKVGVILAVILMQQACSPEQPKQLVLSNTQTITRTDEAIVISRKQLVDWFGEFPSGKVPELSDTAGKPIASQADDLNKDGVWDELALVYSFKPKASAVINCKYVEKTALPNYVQRTNVRFAKQNGKGGYDEIKTEVMPGDHTVEHTLQRYQLEGPVWENDKIGFRNYFDHRNAMDIFGKKASGMVLDQTDLNEKVAEYMSMQPWGMDILKVAGSLGAGGLGLYFQDSLYRVTGAKKVDYELICKGPVRSVFNLSYSDVPVGAHNYNLKQKITIWAGAPGYQSKVWLSGPKDQKMLVSGIVEIKADKRFRNHTSLFTAIGTHGKQAESGDALGMALIFKKADFIADATAPVSGLGVTQTYYAKIKAKDNEPVCFYFVAGWEGQNPEYAHDPFFMHEVNQIQRRLTFPVVVSKKLNTKK